MFGQEDEAPDFLFDQVVEKALPEFLNAIICTAGAYLACAEPEDGKVFPCLVLGLLGGAVKFLSLYRENVSATHSFFRSLSGATYPLTSFWVGSALPETVPVEARVTVSSLAGLAAKRIISNTAQSVRGFFSRRVAATDHSPAVVRPVSVTEERSDSPSSLTAYHPIPISVEAKVPLPTP